MGNGSRNGRPPSKMRAIFLAMAWTCMLENSAAALTLSKDDQAARDAALQWLQVVDSGNYQDAAQMMSEDVRRSQDWPNYFTAHRAPLGGVKKRQIVDVKHASTVPGAADVRNHDIIQFKASFERKSAALEEVVLAKMGCCWEVMGYEIR